VKRTRMSLFLAGRSLLRGNHGVAATTAVMMLLIYVSLLFLPALIQGTVDRINGQLVDTLTSDLVLTPGGSTSSFDDAGALLSQVRHTSGVAHATAEMRVGNQVSYGTASGSWAVDAIDPASFRQVFTTPDHVVEGDYLGDEATDQIFLGVRVAGAGRTTMRGYRASLRDVHANDLVNVTLTSGRTADLTVEGIYDNQFPLSDDGAYISTAEADQLVPADADHATAIYVRTTPGVDTNQVLAKLGALRSGSTVQTSADLGSSVQDQVATFRLISHILQAVSLAMAAITIFIVTYIDLVNRRRNIGIQRAIGIQASPIVASYVLKAWAYTAVGVGAGVLLFGYGITALVADHPFHFPNGPVTLDSTTGEMTRDFATLAVVATAAALAPAIRSVRLPILSAIWGSG
jgi:putative ABC transport system permease protein